MVALLDHLEVDEAVVLGTSLGANTALEVAALAPERLRGMVIEMPVLDNALLACALAFTPLMIALTLRRAADAPLRAARARARAAPAVAGRHRPRHGAPGPGAGRRRAPGPVLRPHRPAPRERRRIETPALVIGHQRDPVHPFSDAGMLAEELPNGRLLEATRSSSCASRPSG